MIGCNEKSKHQFLTGIPRPYSYYYAKQMKRTSLDAFNH